MNLLFIVIAISVIILEICIAIYWVYEKILTPYKIKTANLTVAELFDALELIIKNEIDVYEKSIFDTKGKFLNNQTFETYYKDICERIGESLSDELVERFSFYINEKALYKFITRTVRNYLTTKLVN